MFCNTETGQPLCFSLAKSPYYDTVKTAIEKHGGKIVAPHEPNIDMKLASADMARVGGVCYSQTFVFDAIREQRLPDKEKYLLTEGSRHVETTSSSSEVASKQQVAKKSGRTPFSKEDDDVLIDILVRNTTNTSGNALYKDLEQQNPRHTFHSWRDRAVKVLLPKLKQNGELERRRALLATSSSSKESNVDTTKPVITTATTGSSQCLTSSGTSGLHCAVVAQHVSGRGDKDGKRDQNGPPPESQDENAPTIITGNRDSKAETSTVLEKYFTPLKDSSSSRTKSILAGGDNLNVGDKTEAKADDEDEDDDEDHFVDAVQYLSPEMKPSACFNFPSSNPEISTPTRTETTAGNATTPTDIPQAAAFHGATFDFNSNSHIFKHLSNNNAKHPQSPLNPVLSKFLKLNVPEMFPDEDNEGEAGGGGGRRFAVGSGGSKKRRMSGAEELEAVFKEHRRRESISNIENNSSMDNADGGGVGGGARKKVRALPVEVSE